MKENKYAIKYQDQTEKKMIQSLTTISHDQTQQKRIPQSNKFVKTMYEIKPISMKS